MSVEIESGLFIWSVLSFFLLSALWIAPMIVGGYQASGRGRHRFVGVAAGLVLGWVGVVLLILVSPQSRGGTATR
jgi:hypothetical protein